MTHDQNLNRYNDPDVVAFYRSQAELQPCEEIIFANHIPTGSVILDMGVGAGRTTPYLAARASHYVGADYSSAMVEACRERFTDLEFAQVDATEMAAFADGSFDVVVFSFNGIDTIGDDAGRARCLAETARVLKPGGIFIFSSHNAQVLGVWPQLKGARGVQIPWRIVRSIFKSASLTFRAFFYGVFRAGQGYIRDPVHGGMRHYVSTPEAFALQLARVGLRVVSTVGGHEPDVHSRYLTPWFYYACRKSSAP